MPLAVVRDTFINKSDAMTFQDIDHRRPTTFLGRRAEPIQPDPSTPGLRWRYYGLEEPVPDLTWYDVVDVAELYHQWTHEVVTKRAEQSRVRGREKRTFVTVWDNIPYNNFNSLTPEIVAQATGFIARSDMAVNCLTMYVPEEKVHFCPAGVDTNRFRPKRKERDRNHKPVVLYAGRLVWEKGLMDLLHASQKSPWTLLIAGDGPIASYIGQYIVTHELDAKLLGPIDHDEMPKLYQRADAFCYPTLPVPGWVEQFGISVIEALASGVPCITTDVGAFQDFAQAAQQQACEDAITMVPAMRFDALRAAIYDVVTAPETPLSEAARTLAETVYSSKVVGKLLKEIYYDSRD